MNTLLLDVLAWDLVTDTAGNIAVASDPYSVVQDVASAVRTFLGECYYDTTIGVPYFGNPPGSSSSAILGQWPPLAQFKAKITAQAARVPGCTNPVCYVASVTGRKLSGQIQFTDSNGVTQTAAF